MTTVAQMIQWLQTLPQDAIVKCGREESYGYGTQVVMSNLNIGSCDVFDYTSSVYKNSYHYGKILVLLRAE